MSRCALHVSFDADLSSSINLYIHTYEPPVMASSTRKQSSPPPPPPPPSSSSIPTDYVHVRCLPPPPTYRLTIADLFETSTGGGKPRLDRLREHLLAEGRLEEDAALMIIERGECLLRSESTLIDLEAPITGRDSLRRESTVLDPCPSSSLW